MHPNYEAIAKHGPGTTPMGSTVQLLLFISHHTINHCIMDKKITIKKGIQMGATFGAFTYAYYINFGSGHSYSFQATEEGMMMAEEAWKAGGYEIVHAPPKPHQSPS